MYSNEEKYVTNLKRKPVFDYESKSQVSLLVDAVNETYAPGHWNRQDEAAPFIDDMTGREIKAAKDALYKERKRLEDQRKAINNTLAYMAEHLKTDSEKPGDTFGDLD